MVKIKLIKLVEDEKREGDKGGRVGPKLLFEKASNNNYLYYSVEDEKQTVEKLGMRKKILKKKMEKIIGDI